MTITGVTDCAGRELRRVAFAPGYGEYMAVGDVVTFGPNVAEVVTFGPGAAEAGVRVAYVTECETGGNRKARRRRLAMMRG